MSEAASPIAQPCLTEAVWPGFNPFLPNHNRRQGIHRVQLANPPGWTAGTPGQGATVSQSFTSVNPNDITVAIENDGVNIQGTYPQINHTNETGGLANVEALQLYLSSTPVFGNILKTTISFASPVTNLSFQLWDVDANLGQFIDKITNLQGVSRMELLLLGRAR